MNIYTGETKCVYKICFIVYGESILIIYLTIIMKLLKTGIYILIGRYSTCTSVKHINFTDLENVIIHKICEFEILPAITIFNEQ